MQDHPKINRLPKGDWTLATLQGAATGVDVAAGSPETSLEGLLIPCCFVLVEFWAQDPMGTLKKGLV